MALGRRARAWLAATTLTAVGVPVALAAHVRARTQDDLASAMTRALGEPCRVGRIEAGLTGSVRLTDVALGALVTVDAIEASVSLEHLLGGDLGADEIRVEGPRIAARLGPDGLDLAHVLRRVAARRASPGTQAAGRRLRRVILTEGELHVDLVGLGEVRAREVSLHPEAGGVRVVTGPVHLTAARGGFAVDAELARVAAELRLDEGRVARLFGVGGTATVRGGGATLQLREVSVARGVDDDTRDLWIRAAADDHGVPRPLTLTIDAEGPDRAARLDSEGLPLAILQPLAPSGLDLAAAAWRGNLAVADTSEATALQLDGAFDGVAIVDRELAAVPVPLDGHVRAAGRRRDGTLVLDRLELTRGAAILRGNATYAERASGPAAIAMDLTLAPAPCLAVLDAVPPPMRAQLDGLTLAGELRGRVALDVDLARPVGDGARLRLELPADACRVVSEAPGGDPATLQTARDHVFPDGRAARIGPGTDAWTPIASLPPHVGGAFVSAEDAGFWHHPGFDLEQIARSLEIDLRQGRLARGGSTISQQLVKNVFLSHRRSFDRKLQEAILTWRLEATTSKPQILEQYLNVVELGPGVFGVREAAAFWFGRTPQRLTVRQAAFLAALTPEPRTWHRRMVAAGKLDPQGLARVAQVLRQMRGARVLSRSEWEEADTAPLTIRPEALVAAPPVTVAAR